MLLQQPLSQMPAKLSKKNEKQGHTVEERLPRILASWLWEGNIKILSAFAVTTRFCSHLCLLSPSTCSHREFLFSFLFCGWRCPFLAHCGGHQRAGGLWHPRLNAQHKLLDVGRLSLVFLPTCWRSAKHLLLTQSW